MVTCFKLTGNFMCTAVYLRARLRGRSHCVITMEPLHRHGKGSICILTLHDSDESKHHNRHHESTTSCNLTLRFAKSSLSLLYTQLLLLGWASASLEVFHQRLRLESAATELTSIQRQLAEEARHLVVVCLNPLSIGGQGFSGCCWCWRHLSPFACNISACIKQAKQSASTTSSSRALNRPVSRESA